MEPGAERGRCTAVEASMLRELAVVPAPLDTGVCILEDGFASWYGGGAR